MKTVIEVNHVYSHLLPSIVQRMKIIEWVDWVLSWVVPGRERVTAYQNYLKLKEDPGAEIEGHAWDGRRHLLTDRRLRFPTGLLHRVQKMLWSKCFDFEINDQREYPAAGTEIVELAGVEHRAYQWEGVRAGLRERRGIFDLPPATGKTELMIMLVSSLNVFPVLWLTHETELLEQTRQRFQKRLQDRDITIGQAGSGKWEPGDVTVSTVQSITARKLRPEGHHLIRDAKVVISDEAHHVAAKAWYNILCACPAPYRFGCSATPLMRSDSADMKVIGVIGKVIYKVTPVEAVELGVLSVPSITFHDYEPDGETDDDLAFQHWTTVYHGGIVDNEERNRCIFRLACAAVEEGRKVLILIRMIYHGELLEDALKKWFDGDEHVKFLRGASSKRQRAEAVEAFRNGVVRVVIASSIFDEGVDIPEIDSVIIAAAGKANIKAWQRVGRGMRKSDSDFSLKVHDFVDKRHRHLLTHSRARKKAYRSMGLCKVRTVKETS